MNIVKKIIRGSVIIILTTAMGMFIGAIYGGNFATDFTLGGVQGYEATGNLGKIIGFCLGITYVTGKTIFALKKHENKSSNLYREPTPPAP